MVNRDRGEHLPNLRPHRSPPNPSWLPRQRRGTTPQMIGRYPDFDVLDSVSTWDEATTNVVLARLEPPGPLRFFDPAEELTLRTLCDLCMAQDSEPRIPVAAAVDARLADGELDGYQYFDMPDDRQTWRLVLAGLNEVADERSGQPFATADTDVQEAIVADFAAGSLTGGVWNRLSVTRAWSVCMRYILAGFYSHPWAWNEIGFGGPAYPRGFMRRGAIGIREPFERPGAPVDPPADHHPRQRHHE